MVHTLHGKFGIDRSRTTQQAAHIAGPQNRKFLALALRRLQIQQFADKGTGAVGIVHGIGIIPSTPVAPVRSIPVARIVPPPFGTSVVGEVIGTSDIAYLQAKVGFFPVIHTDVAAAVHVSNISAENFLGILIFPVFGVFLITDDQNAVRQLISFEGFEIRLLVIVGINQIIIKE